MKNLFFFICFLFLQQVSAQYTQIPDPNFEQFLVLEGIDTDGVVNGQVLTSDISDEISLSLLTVNQITDLTGIQDFSSLESLIIYSMNLTQIDLSQNINLKIINFDDMSLENIDVSNNINLEALTLAFNYSGSFFNSEINSIDLSSNVILKSIHVWHTNISELDLSNNPLLGYVKLNDIDFLINVNVKNGSNEDIFYLQIRDNIALQCVEVDNPELVIEGVVPPYDSWFFENNPLLLITDDCSLGTNEYLSSQIYLYPNPVKNTLYINSNDMVITNVAIYNIMGNRVINKKGSNAQIDLSGLSTGLYLVKIQTDNGELIKKVIRE